MLYPILEMVTLLAVSGFLVLRHIKTWKKYAHDKDVREVHYRWNQFRRRLQFSGAIGLAGVSIYLVQYFDSWDLKYFFISALGLILLWMAILGLSDGFVTRKHLTTMRDIKEVSGTSLPGEIKHRSTQSVKNLTLKLEEEPSGEEPSGEKRD